MFQLFNKTKEIINKKTDKETIQEIHESFDSAADRILKEAKEIINSKIPSEKHEKMAKLGFTCAKGVQENVLLKKQIEFQERIADKLSYYSQKYPFYKFITEFEVEKICNKYNLVFGECHQYLGDIPLKNVEEIANFKGVSEEDCKYYEFWDSFSDREEISYNEFIKNTTTRCMSSYKKENSYKICAPISEMKTKGYKQKGYKLVKEVPDPIVLFPVSGQMYVIVSKWGLGSDDELVQNPIEN